jgi:L-ascorbate metabolism protein UlaG (beta-lactamase superfamily)
VTASGAGIFDAGAADGLALAWVNSYSAVAVRSARATLLLDPVSMNVPPGAALDVVAVSHDHSDHWDPGLVCGLQERTGAKVAASPVLAERLERLGCANVVPMCPGDSVSVGGLELEAARCDHPATEPLSFVLHIAGGRKVYLPGDTTPFPEMPSDVDVLFWTGTSLADGAEIARLVNPRLFLTYAIDPPRAGQRAMGILTAQNPQVKSRALRRHEVFHYVID